MFEPFTDRAINILQLANKQAQRFGHDCIGTEHILFGLAQEGNGIAANVLKNLHVDLLSIRQAVEEVAIEGIGDTDCKLAKNVIQYAMGSARELNHHYIGSEHLLLGLLRERGGIAAQILAKLEISLDQTTAILSSREWSPASCENTILEPFHRRGAQRMVSAVFAVALVAGLIFLLSIFAKH